MIKFLQYILDYIFPPNKQELQIRSLPIDWLINNAKKSEKTEFPFIKSLFSYKDPIIRELIWQIKYKKNHHAIECASYSLANALNDSVLLIPIPISKKRRKERGYNQCELIIDEIIRQSLSKNLKKDFGILIRSKDIDKQTFKNRNERLENARNIFCVVNNNIDKNQNIVIIDDVSTTGSTLREARDAMLNAGFTNVMALTIAH